MKSDTGSKLAGPGAEYTEQLARAQSELLETFQKSNQKWADRLQTEVKLFSELSARLGAARSIPEAAAAYQSYANQHLVMANEDARHVFEDYQALVKTGTHLWPANWPVRLGGST
jgi:hypothetical protein